jgi:hypothetical protein
VTISTSLKVGSDVGKHGELKGEGVFDREMGWERLWGATCVKLS